MRTIRHGFRPATVALILLAGITAASATAAPPPQGKTYFTIFVGLEAPNSWSADCLRFTPGRMCTFGHLCGDWNATGAPGLETGFAFEIPDDETGEILIDGQGRIDDRGKKSSLGGVARARMEGGSFNFSFTGRATKRRKCTRLVQEWEGRVAVSGVLSR